jgi:predicted dehydrogenase
VKTSKVGFIGCGNISNQYFKGCATFKILEVVGCADSDTDRARAKAAAHGVKAYTVDEMLKDPEIDIVVNLTVPGVHAQITLDGIAAGKHVHSEKPLALTREDGQRILQAAKEKAVLVGCAPDTFLGGGLQTARKLLDDGWIGRPVAATAFFIGHGPEAWHPNPDFFYKVGGGPMFDVGPYYLTALVHLLGSVKRVTGSTQISFPQRFATSSQLPPELYGHAIDVEIPTHVAGVMDFHSGPVATVITSFDIWSHNLPRIEIYGTEGTLNVPDPNIFGGPVRVRRAGADQFSEIPLSSSDQVGRGIGVADMAYAIQTGRPLRASGALAYHVLDLMHAFHDSSENGQHVQVQSQVERPAPLPLGLMTGILD